MQRERKLNTFKTLETSD